MIKSLSKECQKCKDMSDSREELTLLCYELAILLDLKIEKGTLKINDHFKSLERFCQLHELGVQKSIWPLDKIEIDMRTQKVQENADHICKILELSRVDCVEIYGCLLGEMLSSLWPCKSVKFVVESRDDLDSILFVLVSHVWPDAVPFFHFKFISSTWPLRIHSLHYFSTFFEKRGISVRPFLFFSCLFNSSVNRVDRGRDVYCAFTLKLLHYNETTKECCRLRIQELGD